MATTLAELMARRIRGHVVSYCDRDVLLYALSIGAGEDISQPGILRYATELASLRVLPTFATVVARTPLLSGCGLDFGKLLHGEQRLRVHAPLRAEARLEIDSHVESVVDRGVDGGARVTTCTTAVDSGSSAPVFESRAVLLFRGDGGIGAAGEPPAPLPAVPTAEAEDHVYLPTRTDQALIYRLNGDRNPIHVDPEVARRAGLPRPLLHGLCTFGMCARALMRRMNGDGDRIASLAVRFAGPFYPGETLVVRSWRQGADLHFHAMAMEREVVVLSHGLCTLHDNA